MGPRDAPTATSTTAGCRTCRPSSPASAPRCRWTEGPTPYLPGDIVTWKLPGNLAHIGIVSDRRTADGTPLILHNIGRGAQEEDILFAYPMTGHYRIGKDQADQLKALQ